MAFDNSMPAVQESEISLSKYNTSFFINVRLDLIWKDANAHSCRGMLNQWNLDLDAIWRELARDIGFEKGKNSENAEKKFETKQEKYNEFNEQLSKEGALTDFYSSNGFERITKEEIEKKNKQYQILSRKEIFLKRLENELGKGTKFQDDEEDDW
jgi:DNA-binding protein H-NS